MNNINSSDVSDQINLEPNQNQQSGDIVNQISILTENSSINESISMDTITDSPPEYTSIDHTNDYLNRQNIGNPPTYQDVVNMDTLSGSVRFNRVLNPLEHHEDNFYFPTGNFTDNDSHRINNALEVSTINDEFNRQIYEYGLGGNLHQDMPRNNNPITNRSEHEGELKCTFVSIHYIFVMYVLYLSFLLWVFINIASYDSEKHSFGGYIYLFFIFSSLILESYFLKGVRKETRNQSISYSKRHYLLIFTVKRITELVGLIFCSFLTKNAGQETPIISQNCTSF